MEALNDREITRTSILYLVWGAAFLLVLALLFAASLPVKAQQADKASSSPPTIFVPVQKTIDEQLLEKTQKVDHLNVLLSKYAQKFDHLRNTSKCGVPVAF